MYKHGVAYLERSGPADGEFELSFRHGDMNDVLKSLAVGVASGDASVGAVAFETPTDPDATLAARNLLMTQGDALTQLLHAVRGRAVEVSAGGRSHRGEVIGIDAAATDTAPQRLLVLRTTGGSISLVDLADVRGIEQIEDTSREDLDFLIDRSRAATAGENRTVLVQINGAAEDVRVSYVVPAPVWRVSYRLVCDGDHVTVVAMAIVHNPVDEELSDVELILTTGQPVSFDIDLYHGKWIQRTLVDETDRAAAVPSEYDSPLRSRAYEMAAPSGIAGGSANDGYMVSAAALIDDDTYDATSESGDRGEHFEYRIGSPVSLKRGGASMVPLLVSRVDDVRRERIWRAGPSAAPDIVLVFANTVGVVLEEGPAIVHDDGSYAGEAMVPFTPRGADLRLAFAKDLAVRCSQTTTSEAVTTTLRLGADAVIVEIRHDETHTFRAESSADSDVTLTFELERRGQYELHSDDSPFEQTPTQHRFKVEVPAHDSAELTVGESRRISKQVHYDRLTPDQLQRWLSQRLLDEKTFHELAGVLAHWAEAQRIEDHRERLDEERTEAFEGQARVAEQLEVLRDSGPEGAVRQRTVEQLVVLQDRAAALDAEIRASRDAADGERLAAATELRRLIGQRSS